MTLEPSVYVFPSLLTVPESWNSADVNKLISSESMIYFLRFSFVFSELRKRLRLFEISLSFELACFHSF